MGHSCCNQKAPSSPTSHASIEAQQNQICPQEPSQSSDKVIVAPCESRASNASVDMDKSPGDGCEHDKKEKELSVMTCADGCCGDSAITSGIQQSDFGPSNEIDGQSCAEGDSACCEEGPVAAVATEPGGLPLRTDTKADDCCGPKQPKPSISDASNPPNASDCCRGKGSPCCDEACLDRLALRECKGKRNASFTDMRGRCMLH